MRGYFGIGIDGSSKVGNLGNLIRTAHGFGASFAFALDPAMNKGRGESPVRKWADTSRSETQIPLYVYDTVDEVHLPRGCQMVAVEITDDSIDLPSFRHPTQAVYVLGGERSSVSKAVLGRAHHVIKIPTQFSLNVATAGAIVMYDRIRSLGRFPRRPEMAGQPLEQLPARQGGLRMVRCIEGFEDTRKGGTFRYILRW